MRQQSNGKCSSNDILKMKEVKIILFGSKYSSSFTPQVKQGRNFSQNSSRKSISRNTTHRQSLHLQIVLTGESWKVKTRSEKANNHKTEWKLGCQRYKWKFCLRILQKFWIVRRVVSSCNGPVALLNGAKFNWMHLSKGRFHSAINRGLCCDLLTWCYFAVSFESSVNAFIWEIRNFPF